MSASIPVELFDLNSWARTPDGSIAKSDNWDGAFSAAISYRLGSIGQRRPPPSQVKFRLSVPAQLKSHVNGACEYISRVFAAIVTYAPESEDGDVAVFLIQIELDHGRTFYDPPRLSGPVRVIGPSRPYAGEG